MISNKIDRISGFRVLTLAFCLTLAAIGSDATAESKKLIQIVIDNSGALQNSETGQRTQSAWLQLISREMQRGAGRNNLVHIVTTHNPRTVWEGRGSALLRSYKLLVEPEIKQVTDGCNELGAALKRVRQHVARNLADEIEIYVFSSLIPTGAPCDKIRIQLPQPVPATIDLRSLIQPELTRLSFLWAEENQEVVWADFIERSGMLNDLIDYGVAYSIKGEVATRQEIVDMLQ